MQSRKAELDLRGAIFSVRLSDLMARELILTSVPFDLQIMESLSAAAGKASGAAAAEQAGSNGDVVSLARSLWNQANNDPAVPGPVDKDLLESGHQLVSLMSDMVAADAGGRAAMKLNRAIVSILMHEIDRAGEQVDEVLHSEPTHPNALCLKAILSFYAGNLKESRRAIMDIRGDNSQSVCVLAEGCLAGGDFGQAQALYNRGLQSGPASQHFFIRARLLRLAEISRDDLAAAKLIEEIGTPSRAEHPLTHLALSERFFAIADLQGAFATLEELATVDPIRSNAQLWYWWQLGRMRFLSGAFLSACDCYSKVAEDETVDSLAHREYVHSLYRAGLTPAAGRRAKAIRGRNGRVVPGVSEIEADVMAQSENYLGARGLILELLADRPGSPHLLLSLARLYAATGDFDKARQCLGDIDQSKLQPGLDLDFKSLLAELNQFPAE